MREPPRHAATGRGGERRRWRMQRVEGLDSGAERREGPLVRESPRHAATGRVPGSAPEKTSTVWCSFFYCSSPRGAASPFAPMRFGSARRNSRPKTPSPGRFFLTASSGSAPNKKGHPFGWSFSIRWILNVRQVTQAFRAFRYTSAASTSFSMLTRSLGWCSLVGLSGRLAPKATQLSKARAKVAPAEM